MAFVTSTLFVDKLCQVANIGPPRSWQATTTARAPGLSGKTLSELLNHKSRVSRQTAIRLPMALCDPRISTTRNPLLPLD
jgi:hypothetical protein